MSTFDPEVRALYTLCYDGHVVETPWFGDRFVLSMQMSHADTHRLRVRSYLERKNLLRLRGWMERSA